MRDHLFQDVDYEGKIWVDRDLTYQKLPWIFSLLAILIYFPVVHPFVFLLQLIDFYSRNSTGNGLLLVACKK